jgi:hypothetical protein
LIELNRGLSQREIQLAADEAAREYHKKTPPEERTPTGVWHAMKTASQRFVKYQKVKDFDKYLATANPANGDDFMKQVCILLHGLHV